MTLVCSSPIFVRVQVRRQTIRLLRWEARQIRVARSIAAFYADAEPPPPETDALVTAADQAEW